MLGSHAAGGYEAHPPNTETLDISLVLGKVGVFRQGDKAKTNSKDPNMFSALFDAEDLEDGVAMQTMIYFLEKVVLASLLKQGASVRKQLVRVCKDILSHLEGYPQSYYKTQLPAFVERLKGVIFAFSFIPYDGDTQISNVDNLAGDNSSEIWRAINNESWSKSIIDAVWLTDSQESAIWPAVARSVSEIESADVDVRHTAVTDVLTNYTVWKETLRDGCLPELVHDLLIKDFKSRVTITNVQNIPEQQLDPSDSGLANLLAFVTQANSLWSDLELTSLMSTVQKIAKKKNRLNSILKFSALLQQIPDDTMDARAIDLFIARTEEALPKIGDGTIVLQSVENVTGALALLDFFCKFGFDNWSSLQPRVRNLLLRLQNVVVLDVSGDGPNSMRTEAGRVAPLMAGLQVLLEINDACAAYSGLGDNPTNRLNNEKSFEFMQALQAAKTAFDELPECVTSLLSADQPCQKLLLSINSHIESHGDLYVAASLQPL